MAPQTRNFNVSPTGCIRGLYAVTPDLADTPALLGQVEAALAGGARLLQYRNKIADATLRLEQARALAALCRRRHVPLIINDHLDLALAVDADGLHLGGEDGSIAEARRRLGASKLLGVSCYRRIENALEAARLGADHVAFGGFYPSLVKPGSGGAPLSLLGEAKQRQTLPVVAIGGITVENAPALIAAGADSLAVISALFMAPDIEAAARRFSALFEARELGT
jgi:thiamine-phosphate pyrophosphorylase